MASTRLTRTFTTPTNNKIWTLSFWVKRASLSASQWVINTDGGNQEDRLHFNPEDRLNYYEQDSGGSALANFMPTAQLRDTNGWYHVVLSRDSTQATASDRLKMYYNGELQTVFTANTYPSQNSSNRFNTAVEHEIGARNSSSYFDGYMSHVAFVDGQQLAPTVFGQTDSTSGIWKFKSPSGVTWGNNGFHLKFENSGAMGTDSSGNTNNFTVNGNLKQALDTPSNVYATWNPLHFGDTISTSYGAFTNGNTTYTSTQAGSPYPYTLSTLAPSSGKWYAEFKFPTVNSLMIGVSDGGKYSYTGDSANDAVLFFDGNFYPGNSSWGSAFSDNDIVGVAMDLDNMKIYWHKNGTYFQSGDPTSGSTGTGAKLPPAITQVVCAFSITFGVIDVKVGLVSVVKVIDPPSATA